MNRLIGFVLVLTMMVTWASADVVLYSDDFSSGTEGTSISSAGWTNATNILYTSGQAQRHAVAGEATSYISELALSHTLAVGEVVTLEADVICSGNASAGIGIRTTDGNVYQAFANQVADNRQSTANGAVVGDIVVGWAHVQSQLISYDMIISRDSVSFVYYTYGRNSWPGAASLGSIDISETGIAAIQLRNTFPGGTNPWNTYFTWDNVSLTSNGIPEPGTMSLLSLGALFFIRRRKK